MADGLKAIGGGRRFDSHESFEIDFVFCNDQ
jgi:hypothetical protein